MKVHIEIRPGEGGDDAKLLVMEQARIYGAYAERNKIRVEAISEAKASIG